MPKAPSRNRGQPGGFRNARCHCGVAAEGLVINLVLENVKEIKAVIAILVSLYRLAILCKLIAVQ
jgi:hypothetical protein